MNTVVKYIDNNQLSTVWTRIVSSKLTYVVLAYILHQAEAKFTLDAFMSVQAFMAATNGFLPHALGGAAAILLRSAIKQAELAANANNSTVAGVHVMEVRKQPPRPPASGITALLLTGCLAFSGCDYARQVTDGDGKPLLPPPGGNGYCVTLSDGSKVCYHNPPPPPPPPPAPPPPPQLAK